MICRICQNIRQNKDGSIYCKLSNKYVGINQECNIQGFEMDSFVESILKELEEENGNS